MSDPQPVWPAFVRIADDLRSQGYSIIDKALPAALQQQLLAWSRQIPVDHFVTAGVGRQQQHSQQLDIRSDRICWIDESHTTGQQWLAFMAELQQYLNRQLLLGLFSYESHFACYLPGAFYQKHRDAFSGRVNRVLSTVCYLNPDWQVDDGGELLLYDDHDALLATVQPELGTLVVFLSQEFPHQVLPARRQRYSIAGWFRVNNTTGQHLDPPR